MVRNYQVCGNPLGLGWYSGLAGILGSESEVMRSMSFVEKVKDAGPEVFRVRSCATRSSVSFGGFISSSGAIVLAPVFFIACSTF
jgi:hypothetical protein